MVNVMVRGVPEHVHTALQRRARAQGQSVQQYLLAELERLASRPTMREVLSRIEAQSGGQVGFQEAVETLRRDRDR